MKNNIRILLLMAFGLQLNSCVDLDDFAPTDAIPADGAIHDLATAQAAINGLYDALQDFGIVSTFLQLTQVYSDEADFHNNYQSWDNLEVCSEGAQFSPYSAFYNAINVANNIIEILPIIDHPTLSDEDRNSILSEAFFVRSLCYFYLTNTFGDVPLVLTPTKKVDASLNVSNTNQEKIYDQILEDLQFARESLLNETDTKRANVNAVNALLARIYLYRGNWGQALTISDEVINGYDLVGISYLADEIFYLEFSSTDGNGLATYYGPEEVSGFHRIKPSEKIIASFDSIDMRKEISVAYTSDSIPYTNKYNDFGQFFFGTDPLMYFRYAEVYLIAAEAAAEMGDYSNASIYINQVRNRAGLDEVTLDATNYIDLILQERFIELSFEGPHRWFDLKRRDRAEDEVLGYNKSCNDLWLFPKHEIDNNPNLEQNTACLCCIGC